MEDIEKLQIAARAKNRTIETDKINWRLIFTMQWGGYEVYVDGVIGPWFLKPWIQLARAGMDVRYIVLRPDEPTTVARAMAREQQAKIPLAKSTVTSMWRSLAHLGAYEPYAVDTSAMDSRQSAAYLRERLEAEGFRLLAATEPER